MRKLVILILLLHFYGQAPGQKQGIRGQVFWLSGNQMPGPDKMLCPITVSSGKSMFTMLSC